MSNFDASTPFVLIARIRVKEAKVDDYLQLAEKTDEAVKDTEPGMLHHTFNADPDDPLGFVWTEVFANDTAFIKHLNNPPVLEYLAQHGELGGSASIEVFGTVGEECKELMMSLGLPVRIYESKCGYSRV